MLTPYQFASNTPLYAVDLDGLEAEAYDFKLKKNEEGEVLSISFDIKVKLTVVDLTTSGMNGADIGHLYKSAESAENTLNSTAISRDEIRIAYGRTKEGVVKSEHFKKGAILDVNKVDINIAFKNSLTRSIPKSSIVVMVVDKIESSPYSLKDPSIIDPSGLASLTEDVLLIERDALKNNRTFIHELFHTFGVNHPGSTLKENRSINTLMGYKGGIVPSNKEQSEALTNILSETGLDLYKKDIGLNKNRNDKSAFERAFEFLEENAETYDESKIEDH